MAHKNQNGQALIESIVALSILFIIIQFCYLLTQNKQTKYRFQEIKKHERSYK